MSDTVIQVNNISKQYRLGLVGTGTLSHDLKRWWHLARGKEDPFLKVGEKNVRESKGDSEYVWALKDVSFEVKKGEVLGIIGKNGAGKSTLLKILSRVTSPTTGVFKAKGRIASLLEVGTGFHPELTGRENVFLNGAIFGMTKEEIRRKFDEIVAFSGIERYIDTPVKRYSSGMYVRLAFAVAAHLDPEILIIDEVLAVGDAEFQKKCLGKVKDVAGEGRTVLFVSHNMTAVKALCDNAILLQHGSISKRGKAAEIIESYISGEQEFHMERNWKQEDAPGNNHVKILKASVTSPDLTKQKLMTVESQVELEFIFINFIKDGSVNISLHFHTIEDMFVLATPSKSIKISGGILKFKCTIPGNLLNSITYKIDIVYINNGSSVYLFSNILQFEIIETERNAAWLGKWPGVVRPHFKWEETIIKGQEIEKVHV
jgi:lipopolysaccharide transport system ATP-binding protein